MEANELIPQEGQDFTEWHPAAISLKREMILADHLDFSAFFFPEFEGSNFIVSQHHKVLADTLEKVYTGQIKRLIVNVPPGYTKTELAVINFIARGFAINPRCRFIHLSTSDTLVSNNSTKIRDIIKHPWFQRLFPMVLKSDSQAKHHWKTDRGGELLAVPTMGGVIGLRAGRPNHSASNFTGAIIIDDPIKPVDAMSPTIRKKINSLMNNTVTTRLMVQDVPIILIMQRVHQEDPTDYLLSGGTGDKWHWLNMPALNKSGMPPPVPEKYKKHAIQVGYKMQKGALWPFKHNIKQLKQIEEAKTEDDQDSGAFVWNAQYQQAPADRRVGMFRGSWFRRYKRLPRWVTSHVIYVDSAQKDADANDWSVLAGCATGMNPKTKRKEVFIIDLRRAKLQMPQLINQTREFWKKLRTVWVVNSSGEDVELSGVSVVKVEDKGHGTGLIQTLSQAEGRNKVPVRGIPRSTSKIQRAMPCLQYVQAGRVWLPECANKNTDALWVSDFINEVEEFNEMMTHKNDDQCDVLFDMIHDNLLSKGEIITDDNDAGLY